MPETEKIESYEIEKIKPYGNNAKIHTEAQIAALAQSIREFGWQQPIVVDEAGVILIGHGRYLAAQKLGHAKVPAWRATGLTEEQKIALRIADNKIATDTGFDPAKLEEEFKRLGSSGLDLAALSLDFDFGPTPTQRDMDHDTTEEKLVRFKNSVIKQIVLYFDAQTYEVALALLNGSREALGLQSNTEVVLHLLQKYGAQNANP